MMKRFKQYTFLASVLALVLTLTPSQSFASRYLTVGHEDPTTQPVPETADSRYLAVGHRTGEPTTQTGSMDPTTDPSAQLSSEYMVEALVVVVTGIL